MKIKVNLNYDEKNELDFNQIIFEKLRGSIWYEQNTFTAFEIDKINNDNCCILPNTEAEVILEILDSSVANSIKVGEILYWGVPYRAIGKIFIKEIIIPSNSSFFGS